MTSSGSIQDQLGQAIRAALDEDNAANIQVGTGYADISDIPSEVHQAEDRAAELEGLASRVDTQSVRELTDRMDELENHPGVSVSGGQSMSMR